MSIHNSDPTDSTARERLVNETLTSLEVDVAFSNLQDADIHLADIYGEARQANHSLSEVIAALEGGHEGPADGPSIVEARRALGDLTRHAHELKLLGEQLHTWANRLDDELEEADPAGLHEDDLV